MSSVEGIALQAAFYAWCSEALPAVLKKFHLGPDGSFSSAVVMTDGNTDGTATTDPSVRPRIGTLSVRASDCVPTCPECNFMELPNAERFAFV